MGTHKVKVTQVFRVEREIEIMVEAESAEQAVEIQEMEDAPAYDDDRWSEARTLENESVEISG